MRQFILPILVLAAALLLAGCQTNAPKQAEAPARTPDTLRAQRYYSGFADAHDTYKGLLCPFFHAT